MADGEYHGWSNGESALYLSPVDAEHVGLYLQVARESHLAAVFMDPALAALVQDFLDGSLGATAQANAALLRRLQTEQPLLFVGQPSGLIQPEAEELLLDDEDGR